MRIRALASSGGVIVFLVAGTAILSSCGRVERPEFSTGDGIGHMGGTTGDGDGDTGVPPARATPGDTGEGDNCSSNPCDNGAACIDGAGGFTCECRTGFEGERCETNIDDCNDSPCENGGTCVDGVDEFTCSCPNGYGGELCEKNVDDVQDGRQGDLYSATRSNKTSAFGNPVLYDDPLSSNDLPLVTFRMNPDGTRLYGSEFAVYNLWYLQRSGGTFANPQELSDLEGMAINALSPLLSADEKIIYIQTDGDTWRAERSSLGFQFWELHAPRQRQQ